MPSAAAASKKASPAPRKPRLSSSSPSPASKTPRAADKSKTPSRVRSKSPAVKKKSASAKETIPARDPMSPEQRQRADQNAKLALGAAVILPWVLFPLFGVKTEGLSQSLAFNTPLDVKEPWRLLLLVALLSTPHVFYAWVWTHSKDWEALCHARCLEPYKAFASCAHVIKVIQIVAIAWWARPFIADPMGLIKNIHPLKAVLLLQLFGIGQVLNVEVYNKIGEAGVYYGTRLGVNVPWVFGFPFSVVPHPQYFGATLSFWATFLLLATETTASQGLYILMIVMAFYYAFSSYTEANW